MSRQIRMVEGKRILSKAAAEFPVQIDKRTVHRQQLFQAFMPLGICGSALFEFATDDRKGVRRDAGVECRVALKLRDRVFFDELAHGGDEFER
jgi:hypothetical protein